MLYFISNLIIDLLVNFHSRSWSFPKRSFPYLKRTTPHQRSFCWRPLFVSSTRRMRRNTTASCTTLRCADCCCWFSVYLVSGVMKSVISRMLILLHVDVTIAGFVACWRVAYLAPHVYIFAHIFHHAQKLDPQTQKQRDLRKEFAQFLDSKPDQLEAMLMAPLQRVPQYLTMLINLLGVTDTTHPDYEKLLQVSVLSGCAVLTFSSCISSSPLPPETRHAFRCDPNHRVTRQRLVIPSF